MPNQSAPTMNKLCRQVSIESPGPLVKDCVFSFDVPVPDVPANGARIRVGCAGACYSSKRANSQSSMTSMSSQGSLSGDVSTMCGSGSVGSICQNPSYYGVRDAALFPGYEVAGIVEALGVEVGSEPSVKIGDKVVVYPYEGVPHGYAEYMTVPELKYLVKVPDNMPLSVAAMLPTGALWAMNTIQVAREHILKILQEQGNSERVKVLLVGTGGLALWALRLAKYYLNDVQDQLLLVVASLRDEGILLAKEAANVSVVQWNEDCYERVLIERTKDSCEGEVNIVIDFGTTSRSLHRSLQCLSKGGIVLISSEVSDRLLPKFSRRAEELQQTIKPVDLGSLEQLRELVDLVSSGKLEPPPHTVFPADQAKEVIRKLCNSEIQGRAILRFHSID
ncbi:zinc-type alcohol dehydrogenase-like protein C1773.06c isoform X2 [Folsomia candida]|uniref:NAD-dependent alcohol dehydrogenase n=2 Tax=Folsomia candida TaxID=158441 RepID=A0A226E7P4_FOLCA|nr:zinc-type alcohol dehydrogenase-like protein C1773.06c isoform X2 [Folsomia candida]XP_021954120.1 zinc-type alcohol dehydrogenase-like protein C1773.06c isoform X2 [Folsomia candida]OXA52891.1 NAD-dependent alcohol dehydrogenase [Folsomia candida]